jgi:arsenate reductase (thioredoxin)
MTETRRYHVLFLCTGNSARSVMAEVILNGIGADKFRGYSAGSQPKGSVHPEALRLLEQLGHDTSTLRSKSWDEFATGGPIFDFVFAVCDNAAAEACPIWPGQPMTAHWGMSDPAAATGSAIEIAGAFRDVYRMLHHRITIFTALPFRSLGQLTLKARLREIGSVGSATIKTAEVS